MSNSIDTNSLLQQLRSMAQDAGIPESGAISPEVTPAANSVDFSKVLENSLQSVNERSAEAKQLRESFEAGNPNVELADVMIAAQKARISFEALTQVRNKMVSAYKEIMSMPL
ncbi:MAG: flagellar hook-basal body complex protein FliE [Granulosicoccus sp.]